MSIHQIAFVLSNVPNYSTLVAGVPEGTSVYVLDASGDALAQMVEVLTGYESLDAIHLISHGGPGSLYLGTTTLTSSNLDNYSDQWASLKAALADDADLLIYGCDVAAGDAGAAFIEALAAATGADIAASNDPTGHVALGGDWVLEETQGTVETGQLLSQEAIEAFDGVLATSIANPNVSNIQVNSWSNVYSFGPVAGFSGTVRIVVELGSGNIKLSSTGTGVTAATGYGDLYSGSATSIAFEGTQAQVNTALQSLQAYNSDANVSPTLKVSAVRGGFAYNPENGHYYQYIDYAANGITDRTWTGADGYADHSSTTFNGLQGYLATITSQQENDFIVSKVGGNAWIGASDAAAEGQWRWVTGPETGTLIMTDGGTNPVYNASPYYSWQTGEPNDGGGAEDYAQLISTNTGGLVAGKWNDLPNTGGGGAYAVTGFVIEYGGIGAPTEAAATSSTTLTVQATPVITSNGGGATATLSYAENGTAAVTTVTATDADSGDSKTYSISGGADAGKFDINSSTGALTFKSSPNYEAPGSSNSTNSYSVTVKVTDSTGNFDTQALTVNVANVNEAPSFTSNPVTLPVTDTTENDTFADQTGTVTGSDIEPNSTLTYTLSGGSIAGGVSSQSNAYGLLKINTSTGAYTYTPNAAAVNAVAAGATLTSTFTLRVSDAGGLSATQTLTINLTGANDRPMLQVDDNTSLATQASTLVNLPAIAEDMPTQGQTVANLLDARVTDPDSGGSFGGILITANAADSATQGQWQYKVSSVGSTWQDLPAGLTNTNALALDKATSLRFVPADDYHGTPGQLTVHATDDLFSGYTTDSAAAYGAKSTAGVSLGSKAVGITVDPVNDAPVITSAAGAATLSETAAYDTTANLVVTDPVGSLTGNLAATDVDGPETLSYSIRGGIASAVTDNSVPENPIITHYVTKDGNYGTLTLNTSTNTWTYAVDNWVGLNALPAGKNVTETFTLQVTDAAGATSTQNVVITLQGSNDTPVLAAALGDLSFAGPGDFKFQLPANTFTDAEGLNLAYTATVVDGSGTAIDVGAGVGVLPNWLDFNEGARTFSATSVPKTAPASLNIKVTANDGAASVSDTFALNLSNFGNQAPVLANPVPQQVVSAAKETTEITFADALGGTTIAFDDITPITLGSKATGAKVATAFAGGTTNYNHTSTTDNVIALTAKVAGARTDFTDSATVNVSGGSYTVAVQQEGADGTAESTQVQFLGGSTLGAGTLTVLGQTVTVLATDDAAAVASKVVAALSSDATWDVAVDETNTDTVNFTAKTPGNQPDLLASDFTIPSSVSLATAVVTDLEGTDDSFDSYPEIVNITFGALADGVTGSLTFDGKTLNLTGPKTAAQVTQAFYTLQWDYAGVWHVNGGDGTTNPLAGSNIVQIQTNAFVDYSPNLTLDDFLLSKSAVAAITTTDGTDAIAEVVTLTFDGAYGGADIAIDGTTQAAGNSVSANDVATAVRDAPYTNYDTSGSGATVVFTAKTPGDKTNIQASDFSGTYTTTGTSQLTVGTPTNGGGWSYTLSASPFTDADSDTLTYTAWADATPLLATGAGLTFDPATLKFTGDGTALPNGGVITLKAVDASGSNTEVSTTLQFTLQNGTTGVSAVGNDALATTWTGAGSKTYVLPANTFAFADGGTLSFSAKLADNSALPTWLSIDATNGKLSGNPPADAPASLSIVITATDNTGTVTTATKALTLTINTPNDAPVLSGALSDETVTAATNFSETLGTLFTDSDGAAADIAYSVQYWNGSAWTALPTTADGSYWLSFDPNTKTFAGNPPANLPALNIQVTGTDAGGATSTTTFTLNLADATSYAFAANNPGAVTVSGTPTQGQTLTANAPTDTDGVNTATVSYQWQVSTDGTNWLDVDGARGKAQTLTLAQTESGKQIQVLTFYTDKAGVAELATSTALTVTDVNDTGMVTFTAASLTPDETLTALLSDPDGLTNATPTYQWYRSADTDTNPDPLIDTRVWTPIAGATQAAYTIVTADGNNYLRAEITYTDDLTNTSTVYGATSSKVTLGAVRPTAVNDANTVLEAGGVANSTPAPAAVSDNVLTNDTDANFVAVGGTGDTHTVTSLRTGATEGIGNAAVDTGTTLVLSGAYGNLVLTKATGFYTYTLAQSNAAVEALGSNQTLTESFNYTVSDSTPGGSKSDIGVLAITINGADDAPVITGTLPASMVQIEDAAGSVDLSAIDISDVDSAVVTLKLVASQGTLAASSASGVTVDDSTPGTLTLSGSPADVTAFLNNSNFIQYTSALHDNGSPGAALAVSYQDHSMGTSFTSLGTVNLNITAVNDAPTGADKSFTILEDTPQIFTVADFVLTDVNDTVTGGGSANSLAAVKITTLPASGAVQHFILVAGVDTWTAVTEDSLISAADINAGKLRYMPGLDGNGGTPYTSFTFQVQDNGGTDNDGVDLDPVAKTFTFSVIPVNDAPVLANAADSAPVVTTITENDIASAGNLISALVRPVDGTSDATGVSTSFAIDPDFVTRGTTDGSPNEAWDGGVAIYALSNAGPGGGTWQYKLGSESWTDVPVLPENQGLLLRSTDSIRFVPGTFEGTTASFSYYLWDGSSGTAGSTADVTAEKLGGSTAFSTAGDVATISVTEVNDAPIVDINGTAAGNNFTTIFRPVGGAIAVVDSDFDLREVDGTQLQSATVTLATGALDNLFGKYESLSSSYSGTALSVTGNGSGAGGLVDATVLTFTGAASLADYEAALKTVVYNNTNSSVTTGDRTVTISVTDNEGASSLASNLASFSTTAANALVAVGQRIFINGTDSRTTVAVVEDSQHFVASDLLTGLKADDILSFQAAGAEVTTGTVATGPRVATTTIRTLWSPVIDLNGTANGRDYTTTFIEDTTGVAIAVPQASIADQDGSLASVTVTLANPKNGSDEYLFLLPAQQSLLVANGITLSGNQTATLTFTGNKDASTFQQFLRGVQYVNNAITPDLTQRVVTVSAEDADGNPSISATTTINVVAVNDAPVGTNGSVTINENASHTFTVENFGFTDSLDSPANELLAVKITTLPTAGSLKLDGVVVTAGAFVSATDINAGKLIFTPTGDGNGNSYASLTFQVQDNGGVANGGIDLDASANTFTINVTPVNDAPVLSGTGSDFTTVNENATTDGLNAGTAVSALLASISDADTATQGGDHGVSNGTQTGMALYATSVGTPGGGTWQYKIDAGEWTAVGEVSDAGALLLKSTDLLRFVPDGQNATSASLSYYAWDQSSGTAGTTTSVSTRGTTTAFSEASDTANITVTAVNDAPTLDLDGSADGTSFTTTFRPRGSEIAVVDGDISITDVDKLDTTHLETISQAVAAITAGARDNDFTLQETLTAKTAIGGTAITSFTGGSGAVLTITGNGTVKVTISGDGTPDDYEAALKSITYNNANPNAYSGDRTVTVTITDSNVSNAGSFKLSTSATTTIQTPWTPVVDMNGGNLEGAKHTVTYTEGQAGVAVATGDATLYDQDGYIAELTLTLKDADGKAPPDGAFESLFVPADKIAILTGLGITTTQVDPYTIKFAGYKDATFFQIGLRSVQYTNTSIKPNPADRIVTVTSKDVDGHDGVGSITTITMVGVNSAPTLEAVTAGSIAEDVLSTEVTNSGLSGTLLGADVEAAATGTTHAVSPDTLTYGISGAAVAGGVASKTGTYGTLAVNTATGAYTYTPTAISIEALDDGESRTDSFTVTVTDGIATTTQFYTVNVSGADDAPTLAAVTGGTIAEVTQSTSTTDVALTGTLAGVDVDDETLTYGISGGTVETAPQEVEGETVQVATGNVTKVGSYGTLTLNTTTGVYSYAKSAAAIEALDATETGSDSFTVTVTDGDGDLVTRTYTVNVSGADDAPTLGAVTAGSIAEVDQASTTTDANLTGTLVGADVDVETLSYGIQGETASDGVVTKAGTYGTLTVNTASGAYSYAKNVAAIEALDAGENRSDVFTVTVSDSDGDLVTRTYTVNVSGADDAPTLGAVTAGSIAEVDQASTTTDANLTGTLVGADVDVETLSYGIQGETAVGGVVTKAGTYGTLTVNASTGAYEYAKNADAVEALDVDETGSDSFTVTVTDGDGELVTRTYTVNVSGADDAPTLEAVTGGTIAEVDQASTTTDANLTGTLAGADVDVETLSYGIAQLVGASGSEVLTPIAAVEGVVTQVGTYGTLTVNASNGTYSYAKNAAAVEALDVDETGSDSFIVTVTDGDGDLVTRTYTVNLSGADDAPTLGAVTAGSIAEVDQASTTTDANLTGTLVGADVDVETLSYGIQGETAVDGVVTKAGTYGTLTVNTASGAYSYAKNAAAIEALDAGENRSDVFTVTVSDSDGDLVTRTYTVNVSGADDAPMLAAVTGGTIAEVDQASTTTDANLTGTLAGADVDVETLSYGIAQLVNSSGSEVLTPIAAVEGVVTQVGTYGTLTVNTSTGAYEYTKTAAAVEALDVDETGSDSFTVTVTDGDGDLVTRTYTVNVSGADDAPTLGAVTAGSIAEVDQASTTTDANLTGTLASADVDVETLTYGIAQLVGEEGAKVLTPIAAMEGVVTQVGTYGALTVNASNGTYTYTKTAAAIEALDANETGSDSFTVTVTDGDGDLVTRTYTVNVSGADDAPTLAAVTGGTIAEVDQASTTTDANLTGTLAGADVDVETLTYGIAQLVGEEGAKVLTPIAAVEGVVTQVGTYGTLTVNTSTGAYEYTKTAAAVEALDVDETGSDSFTVTVTDGDGDLVTRTYTVNVTGGNDAPSITTAIADFGYTEAVDASAQDLSSTGTLAFADIDTNDVIDVTSAVKTSAVWSGGDIDADLKSALESGLSVSGTDVAAPGSVNWTYTVADAALDFLAKDETITLTYTVTVTDNNGVTATDDVSITITGTNDAPTITTTIADFGFTEAADASAQDLSSSGTLAFADIDTTDVIDVTSVVKTAAVWSGGAISDALKNKLQAGLSISGTDVAAPGSVGWTYAVADAALDFLAKDETITLTYTVTVTDNNDATATDDVSITITGTNDAPTITTAIADFGFTEAADASAQDLSSSGTLAFADIDTTDVIDVTSAVKTSAVWSGGTISDALKNKLQAGLSISGTDVAAPGSVGWTYAVADAALDFLAKDETITLTYMVTVTDNNGATATDDVTITITGTNDAPVAIADTGTAREKSGLDNAIAGFDTTGSLLSNDTDVDATDTRTVVNIQAVTGSGSTTVVPANSTGEAGYVAVAGLYGTLRIGADGSYRYLVDETKATVQALRTQTEKLQDVFNYTMQDGQAATASSTLTITVEGANDAPTLVRVSNLAITELTGVTPNTTAVTNVGTLSTDDPDAGETFVYDIIGGAQQFYFQISTVAGVATLQLKQGVPLNAEYLSEYSVVVRSTDALNLSTFETFVVKIGDVNEFGVTAPTFNVQPMAEGLEPNSLPENTAVNTFIGVTASAVDADATNNTVTFTLVANALGGTYTAGEFRIDGEDGKVYVAGPIDREGAGGGSRTLFVKATSTDGSSAIRSLNLFITDVNEFSVTAPSDTNVAANVVLENSPFGLNVGITASASDADATTNVVSYKLVNANGSDYEGGEFVIGSSSGVITVAGSIDRELGATRTLYVKSTSADGSSAMSTFTVNVNDVNEFAPVVTSGATGSVDENAVTTKVIYQAAATDGDATAVLNYGLTGTDAALLNIDAATGAVTLKASADFEAMASYSFNVLASDGANSTTQAVVVSVANLNDNAPVFTSGATGSVKENAATSTVVYTAVTTDADNLAARSYSLSGTDADLLTINASTGAVTLKASADFEAKASYSFNVLASDGANTTTQAVVVSVANLNDNASVFTSGAVGSVDENAATSTVIYTAATTDADNLAASIYSLAGTDADLLEISTSTGAVTLKASADHEKKASYSFNVLARDGTNSTTQAVVVSVGNLLELPALPLEVTGKLWSGEALTLNLSDISEQDQALLRFQWTADGQPIDGATASSFTLGDAQVGKVISVLVSGLGISGNVAVTLPGAGLVGAVDPASLTGQTDAPAGSSVVV